MRSRIDPHEKVAADQALCSEIRHGYADLGATTEPQFQLGLALRSEHWLWQVRYVDAIPPEQVPEATFARVLRHAVRLHDQTELTGLVAELFVVVIPLARFAVSLLPG